MPLSAIQPTSTESWSLLLKHFQDIQNISLKSLFEQNPNRSRHFSIDFQDFVLDYSKNHITTATRDLLLNLADEMQLPDAIDKYFNGDKINETEGRAVSHTALRNFEAMPPEVSATLQQMQQFSDEVINGGFTGYTGKPMTDIVNIGIGGSDLGPRMVTDALRYYKNHLNVHYVSNVDGDHIRDVLKGLNPETTLFIVVSKSFTTQETLMNARAAKKWLLQDAPEQAVGSHFVAVSTNLEAVAAFGIAKAHTFPMWDWVGGRFSLWSAVGLSTCCAVGYNHFEALLKGAHEMDQHFKNTPLKDNMPVLLALLSVWYNNFFEVETEAVVPYSQYLDQLVPYLQQAVMESNGKSVDRNGNKIDYQTGTIVWGHTGTNAQHAFFQLLHQGTKRIPVDFIGFKDPLYGDRDHHDVLLANMLAQTEALMQGKTQSEVHDELQHQNLTKETINKLLPYKVFDGNRPSNTLLISKLTPKTLGSLIALYEHKIFVQGVLWNIYSYDQWGVELGKELAKTILKDFSGATHPHDSSTAALINHLKK